MLCISLYTALLFQTSDTCYKINRPQKHEPTMNPSLKTWTDNEPPQKHEPTTLLNGLTLFLNLTSFCCMSRYQLFIKDFFQVSKVSKVVTDSIIVTVLT